MKATPLTALALLLLSGYTGRRNQPDEPAFPAPVTGQSASDLVSFANARLENLREQLEALE